MPWHGDIIQPKGQGMEKRVTDSKSAHCTQPFWSPRRGSGQLGVWIHPEGPLKVPGSHTASSQVSPHSPCAHPAGVALLCSHSTTGVSSWHSESLSPLLSPALPSSHPTHNSPMRDFYPNGWK